MKNSVSKCLFTALILSAISLSSARAEFQFSGYTGWQSAPHSDVTVSDGHSFNAGWEGRSFEMPPYWGVRATWWMDNYPQFGISLDFSHAKVYADDQTMRDDVPTWSAFEFSDGLNLLTVNAMYRFEPWGQFRPYVGAGVGLSIPHVEVSRPSGETFEYQIGGAAFQVQAGVEYDITPEWAVFAEYKGNYAMNDVDIDSGASLKTDILTNAVNFGVSYRW